MKFLFEDQPHQAAATAAVVDLFDGSLVLPVGMTAEAAGATGHAKFSLRPDVLLDNVKKVAEREQVPVPEGLSLLEVQDLLDRPRSTLNFSVEMETGTGKTYVYINTALRLAEQHGLRKFVILVHSVAIKAGVIKTFEQTAAHFKAKYPATPYAWGALGDGPALNDFLEPSSRVQFLVVMIQSIDKPASNAVYQTGEQASLWDEPSTGIAGIAALNPVVVVDEPQNMATPLRRRAIATLNPFVVLRYSATHREVFNLVHRLGPRQASEQGLVKPVAVKGVVAGDGLGAYIEIEDVRSVKRRVTANLKLNRATASGIGRATMPVRVGDDLRDVTGIDAYRGYVVREIAREPDRVEFENDVTVSVDDPSGFDRSALWRDQIRHTIRQHLDRQRKLDESGHDVKVLSLFFIEHVADYEGDEATLPALFDELYREEWRRATGSDAGCPDPAQLRTAYFAITKRGVPKDTTGSSADEAFEARAYEEIIKNKELILTKDNPRSFIFSHSALREGWDNPNVFQICFLRHSNSDLERRQQIGRGLRLPVDVTGRRVVDRSVTRLTLVVDESFAEFRDGLNAEYAAARGDGDDTPPPPDNADDEITVRRRPTLFGSPEFQELWKRIRYKAVYRVSVDPAQLPSAVAASALLDQVHDLVAPGNIVQTAELQYDDEGRVITSDDHVTEAAGERLSFDGRLPHLIRLIEDQLLTGKYPLQLSRRTMTEIVGALPPLVIRRSIYDPERWCRIVAAAIRKEAVEEMVQRVAYEPLAESEWWDAEVVFLEAESVIPPPQVPPNSRGVVASSATGTNLYDHLIYDSLVEKDFAAQLDNNDAILVFSKLPRRFSVRTPIGDYSPDWAIVWSDGAVKRLYLVRETKSELDPDDLDWDEKMRIMFAEKHFAAAPSGAVSFKATTPDAGLRLDSDA